MNKAAVQHTGTYPDIYLDGRDRLVFRLQTGKGDLKACILHCYPRTDPEKEKILPLQIRYRDDLHDYYYAEIEFSKVARYQKYYFELQDETETVYLTAQGFTAAVPSGGQFEFLYANATDTVTVPPWSVGAIYYQIFPERFCNGRQENDPEGVEPWGTMPTRENYMGGDLKGIQEKLGYLQDLGIECIYLNPIFKADFNHKYATTDYYKIDPQFGTEEDLIDLVKEAHEKGIRIILDGVFNHTGIHFKAFEDILEHQEESPYKDWYYINQFPLEISHHNYECVGAYKYMPKLNSGNPEVRRFILDVMTYWIERADIDGWRLDVADEVDESVWHMARILLKEKYPDKVLLGETWGNGLRLMNGSQMDSIMNYTFRDAVRDFVTKGEIDAEGFASRVQRMLARYPQVMDLAMFNLLDSHDTERFLYLCGEDTSKLIAAVTLQMMFPGSPSIYYGDEVGMTGDNDPDCRRCMIWERENQNQEVFDAYRALIRIRKENDIIRTGDLAMNVVSGRVIGFSRCDRERQREIVVLVNTGDGEVTVDLPVRTMHGYHGIFHDDRSYVVRAGVGTLFHDHDMWGYAGSIQVTVGPMEAKIFKGGNEYEEHE